MNKQHLAAIPNPRSSSESAAPRPFWQTEPCPPWCQMPSSPIGHTNHDDYDEREHFRSGVEIPLTLCEADGPGNDTQPPEMTLGLFQHYRAAAADILLGVPVADGFHKYTSCDVRLTVEEVRALRDGLSALLDAVDAAGNAEVAA